MRNISHRQTTFLETNLPQTWYIDRDIFCFIDCVVTWLHLIKGLLQGRLVLLQPDRRSLHFSLLGLHVAYSSGQRRDPLRQALFLDRQFVDSLIQFLLTLLPLYDHLETGSGVLGNLT